MPELPEVETVRRGLVPRMVGHRIVRLIQRRKDLRVKLPAKFAAKVEGRIVTAIDRRAKYMLMRLDDGQTLIVHLGMSGRMTLHDAKSAAEHPFERHDHVVFDMDDGWQVRFNDARRFGLMLLVPTESVEKHKAFKGLGPEPLDEAFDGAALAARLKGRAHADQGGTARPEDPGRRRQHLCLRSALSCPASRRAAPPIPSRANAPSVSSPRSSRCCCARSTDGGSTLRDHVQPGGELGYFQTRFKVYDRVGAPCPTRDCGHLVKRLVQGGRSTFYCAHCQR